MVSNQKLDVNQIDVTKKVTCHFFLAAFKICFLSLVFKDLAKMRVSVSFSVIILVGVH